MTQKKKRKVLRNRNGTSWISPEFRDEIIEYYVKTGDHLRVIGEKFGISHTCVHNIITEYFKKKA